MHGQYGQQLISEEGTFLWLSKGDRKAETESEVVAAQDQALHAKYYVKKNIEIRERHHMQALPKILMRQ